MGKQIMVPYVDPNEQVVVELSVRDLTRSVSFYRRSGLPSFARKNALPFWPGRGISSSCNKQTICPSPLPLQLAPLLN
jgi:hypothetical protein